MKVFKLAEEVLQAKIHEVMSKYNAGQATATINFDNMMKLEDPKEKLEVAFTQTAWDKMHALVKQCSTECAWHGIVKPTDKGYAITDILVYPQRVASVTVEADDDKYNPWLMTLTDDQINNMRMQGHSHVNMGVHPSSVDKDYYATMMHHVQDYYIFLIVNKKQEVYCEVYDVINNVVYEPKDCVIKFPAGQTKWADTQLEAMVTKPVITTTVATSSVLNTSATGSKRRTTPWWEPLETKPAGNIRSLTNYGTDAAGAYFIDSTGGKVRY